MFMSCRLVLIVDWCAIKARLGKGDPDALPLSVPEGLFIPDIRTTLRLLRESTIISDTHV